MKSFNTTYFPRFTLTSYNIAIMMHKVYHYNSSSRFKTLICFFHSFICMLCAVLHSHSKHYLVIPYAIQLQQMSRAKQTIECLWPHTGNSVIFVFRNPARLHGRFSASCYLCIAMKIGDTISARFNYFLGIYEWRGRRSYIYLLNSLIMNNYGNVTKKTQ